MTDMTTTPPRSDNGRAGVDPHEAAGYAFGTNYAMLLREREQLRERVDLLLAEQGAFLARIAEMTRAIDQKEKRETESIQREVMLHGRVSLLVATVEIARDALEKAITEHQKP